MVAGADTTSNLLTALLLYVFEKPEVAQRLRDEINSVIKSEDDITVENMKKLPYLECVISETSRMFNPAPGLFQRELTEDTTLGKVPLKKGVLIDSIWVAILFNPTTFADPLEFKPERWEKEESK